MRQPLHDHDAGGDAVEEDVLMQRIRPLPALRPFVAAIALMRSAPHVPMLRPRLFPEGLVDLVISLGARPRLLGGAEQELPIVTVLSRTMACTDFVLPAGLWSLHVTLTHRGADALFRGALAENPLVLALDDIGRSTFTRAVDQLWELDAQERIEALQHALLAQLDVDRDLHPDLSRALAVIHAASGALPIRRVAAEVGLSQRQLERRFCAALGFAPKQYARITRFNRARAILAGPSFDRGAAVAAELGYTDQTHLIDEFRAFAGMTPLAYRTAILRQTTPNPFTTW